MSNKNSVVLAVLVGLFLIVGLAWYFGNNESSIISQGDDFEVPATASMHNDYPELGVENQIVQLSGSEVVEVFQSGSGVVFLGFKECPWCQELLPRIDKVAAEEGIEIYYFDVRAERQNNSGTYQELVDVLDEYLPRDENGQPRIMVPDLTIVRDGEIVWRYETEEVSDTENTPATYWTAERAERKMFNFKNALQLIK